MRHYSVRLFCILCFYLLSAPLCAAPGDLDTTFRGGWVAARFDGNNSDYGADVLQQVDGKLLVAGSSSSGNYDFALARYKADGASDTGFDGTGTLTTAVSTMQDDFGTSVIQQFDGKLVLAGSSFNGSSGDFALVRYNLNSTLDTSFGNGGKLTTAVGVSDDQAHAVIQQADGKLVVVGASHNGSNYNFAMVRYNIDGALDTTFDGDGKLTTVIGQQSEAFSALQQADGKLLVAGYSGNGSVLDIALVRYNLDGSLDATFDGDGKLTTTVGGRARAYSVIQQADGKLLVAGFGYIAGALNFALVRYNLDGSLDATFDGDGKLTMTVGDDAIASSVIQQADGRLVVAGYSYNGSNDDFALVRFNSDGSLDTTFGGDGKVTLSIGDGDDHASAVIQQADGKLVVAGSSVSPNESTAQLVVARFESGQPDTDSDGYIDGLDTDDDNDGVADGSDAFPLNAAESIDTDHDGIGNNADPDDDNDGFLDGVDLEPLNPLVTQMHTSLQGNYKGSSIHEEGFRQ